jgi:hypothetical protein
MLSTAVVFAQDDPQNGRPPAGWRRMNQPQEPQAQGPPPASRPLPPLPPELTIPPGTYLTIRANQVLSSDHNQQGDAFSATLVKPVVVDGIVVADRGQVIQGRISEAQKAGRAQGTSRLGLELTDMTLVDGHQVPVHTQLVNRNGSTSVGRDAATVGTTTALGAIIGAAAGLGKGAAIGAGAGAAAGIAGVMLTRGNPTVVYPEQVLTFQLENPVTVSTARAPQAFREVDPGDYQQPSDEPRLQSRPSAPPRPYYGPGYGWDYGYPYYGYPYYGYPYGYPYYYGPSIGFNFGYGHFYGGHGGRGRR